MNTMQVEVHWSWRPHVAEEVLSDGRTVWVARHAEIPGVVAQGDSEREALEIYAEMLADVIAELKDAGKPLPQETAATFKVVLRDSNEVAEAKIPDPTRSHTVGPKTQQFAAAV